MGRLPSRAALVEDIAALTMLIQQLVGSPHTEDKFEPGPHASQRLLLVGLYADQIERGLKVCILSNHGEVFWSDMLKAGRKVRDEVRARIKQRERENAN